MASRNFQKFTYGLEQGIVNLWGNIAVGASGAPTIVAAKNKGIGSVVRNSAGNYTINLQDRYQYLAFLDQVVVLTSGAPSASTNLNCIVRADNSNTATPSVTIEFVNASGTAVDLTSGCAVLVNLTLKNSGV